MLVIGTMTMAVNFIVMLSGSVIAGNLVGAMDGRRARRSARPRLRASRAGA